MKFIIISAVYNMAEHLKNNIDILKAQTFSNFEVYLGDDLSTDASCEVIEDNIKDDSRFHLVRHEEKQYSTGNIAKLIELASPEDDDVIVLIDGDDALASTTSLEYLNSVYEKTRCWMTFGTYSVNGKLGEHCGAYPNFVKKLNLYRYVKWRASHLKTFKMALWKKIKSGSLTLTEEERQRALKLCLFTGRIRSWLHFGKVKLSDVVTEDGCYIRRCGDKYITLPLLEMAGDKAVFIDKVIYHYTGPQGPHNFGDSSKKWSQRLLRKAVSLKPRYKRLLELD